MGAWGTRPITIQPLSSIVCAAVHGSVIYTIVYHCLGIVYSLTVNILCTAVTCGYLFQPYNGKVEWNSQSVGSVATYTCNTGFTLAGSGERTCQQDGEWSGVKPYCNCMFISLPCL